MRSYEYLHMCRGLNAYAENGLSETKQKNCNFCYKPVYVFSFSLFFFLLLLSFFTFIHYITANVCLFKNNPYFVFFYKEVS